MTTTDKIQTAAFFTAMTTQSLFILLYSRRPWRKYVVGRALMQFSLVLWCLLAIPLANVYLNYRAEEWVEAVIFWLMPVVILAKIRSLICMTEELK